MKKSIRWCPACRKIQRFAYDYSIRHSCCEECGYHGKGVSVVTKKSMQGVIKALRQENEELRRRNKSLEKRLKKLSEGDPPAPPQKSKLYKHQRP